MTEKELQMLASLITGKGMKKEASAEKTAEDTAKLNAYYGNLMQQGAFGQKKAAVAFSQALKVRVPYEAVTTKIFAQDNISNNVAWADVEFPEIGAAVVPFKGAPARIEKGPKRIFYNTHTAAINWIVAYDQVFTAAYNTLDEAKNKVAIGLALELDTELFKVLAAADAAGVYGTPMADAMSLSVINDARAAQMELSLITTAIVMHPSRYYQLLNVTSEKVDQVTLNTIVENGYVGQLLGVKFIVSKLCPKNKAYAITAPEYLGKYVLRQPEQMKVTDMPWKLEYVVTGYANYGLVLHNIPAVYPITFTDGESI
jgi:hypothetical protein